MVLRSSIYKKPAQLRAMVEPGLITAAALDAVREMIAPGVTTLDLDAAASRVITGRGAKSNFQMVRGYRHTICASVNDQVVHGIPNDRPLQPGDLLSIDAGAEFRGWNGDSAFTVVVPGDAPEELIAPRRRLSDVTEGSLWAGIAALNGPQEAAERMVETFEARRGVIVAALNAANVTDEFTYVSTAGGAFLEWLEGKSLPGVDILKAKAE